MEPKTQKRASILNQRQKLNPEFRAVASAEVARSLFDLKEYQRVASLGLYAAFDNEVETEAIFHHSVHLSKKVFYPKANSDKTTLSFHAVSSLSELTPGYAGILEPVTEETENIQDIQMLVIPGVAFDRNGNRLGYGHGFYDRLLKNYRGYKIALAYEFQLLDVLPTDSTDEIVDVVVTEEQVVRIPN